MPQTLQQICHTFELDVSTPILNEFLACPFLTLISSFFISRNLFRTTYNESPTPESYSGYELCILILKLVVLTWGPPESKESQAFLPPKDSLNSSGKRRSGNIGSNAGAKRLKSVSPAVQNFFQHFNSSATKSFPRAYTQHTRFWAPEENILMQIEAMRFKLYPSQLASQSPWFEDLFEKHAGRPVPQRDADENNVSASVDNVQVKTVEGQNVFLLDPTGLRSDGFEILLTAMDDGM
jgi:hypothetical protein